MPIITDQFRDHKLASPDPMGSRVGGPEKLDEVFVVDVECASSLIGT